MRSRPAILKVAVILLMLVFIQKTGGALFLHNIFHKSYATESSSSNEEKGKEISYACNCIDDFLAPFTEAETVSFPHPAIVYQSPVVADSDDLYSLPAFFSSLRGPPNNKC